MATEAASEGTANGPNASSGPGEPSGRRASDRPTSGPKGGTSGEVTGAARAGKPGARASGTRAAGPARKRETRRRVATPWGAAAVVEEAKVTQRAGDKRFSTVLELLESDRGETLVRIAYTTDGVARRGPVTLRARDLEKLRSVAASEPQLAEILGWSEAATDGGGA